MYRVQVRAVVGLCVLLVWGTAVHGQPVATAKPAAAKALADAQQELQTAFPGVQLQTQGTRTLAVYGKPMTAAETPGEAAQWWIEDHAAVLGVSVQDLQPVYNHEVSVGKFTVFVYDQMMDGLPVEQGRTKVLVLNGQPNQVVYVGARLAQVPEKGFRPDALDAEAAMAVMRRMPEYAGLTEWTAAEKVVYYGEGDGELITPVRAWKFTGYNKDKANHEAHTFFVDAADGTLVYVRDEVYDTDVEGHVSGMGSPGVLPDIPSNPEQEIDLQDARVRISGGSTSYTDGNGDYVIPNGGSDSVTVIADIRGRWANVNNSAGGDLQLSQDVSPPGPADFLFNTSPTEYTTAQVNGYIHTTSTHNFYKSLEPGYTGLDEVLPCYVNIDDSCNAYFTTAPKSINFFRAQGGCNNTAYSSVIAHEFGHFIVNELGLSQGAFGEGFGDCVAVLEYDDGIVGRNFTTGGGYIRNIAASNVQYPCSGEIHYCGQLLAGIWWDLKLDMQAYLGSGPGLAATQQLFADWSVVTSGGPGGQSAGPGTVTEVLTVDDDNGDLSDGTPHFLEICSAFSAHGIDCPEMLLLEFEYPDGRPEIVPPNQSNTVRVNVLPFLVEPVPGTGTVSYRIGDSGSFTTEPMTELQDNEYEAPLPAADCRETIEYYISVDQSHGGTADDPADAPTRTYTTFAGTGFNMLVDLDFETDPGWIVSGSATEGQWEIGVPVGGGDRGDPPTDFDGSGQCWLTGNADGDSDVEGGQAILTTTPYDLTGMTDPLLTYARWYSNDTGNYPYSKVFAVIASDDGGANWMTLDYVGPGGPDVSGGWIVKTWRILDYFPALTSNFVVRFQAFDSALQPSIIEAGIDAFKIFDIECAGAVAGDLDGDGDVDLDDFALFAQCFAGADNPPAAGCAPGVDADLDNDGDVDLDDFAIFGQNFTGSQ